MPGNNPLALENPLKRCLDKMLARIDVEAQFKKEFVKFFSSSQDACICEVLTKDWNSGKPEKILSKHVLKKTPCASSP
jgi:hypothetical protein